MSPQCLQEDIILINGFHPQVYFMVQTSGSVEIWKKEERQDGK